MKKTCQKLWDTEKAVLREQFIALNASVGEEKPYCNKDVFYQQMDEPWYIHTKSK